nr:hypothetical protein [Acetatifactor aquisgranensis]
MHDWDLKTNIDEIYACGDQLYASDCAGAACATGYYAGRKAADYAEGVELCQCSQEDIRAEKERLYAPLSRDEKSGISWKELNKAISKAMQNYCGGVKCDSLLLEGLDLLKKYEEEAVPVLYAANPHELMRVHEVMDILTVARLVLQASLARKSSSEPLCFMRSDYPETDSPRDRKYIVIRQEDESVVIRQVPLDFFGDLEEEYEKRNRDYMEREAAGNGR